MELIVIGDNRLKIMLTGEDMVHYDLAEPDSTGSSVNSITPHTREVLRHIFADAHNEIGFDTEGERLFVQLYASKGGGCEIFVTKLGEAGEIKLLKKIMGGSETSLKTQDRTIWFSVDGLEVLTALCKRLDSAGFDGKSALYIHPEQPGTWYLSVTLQSDKHEAVCFPLLFEYGEEVREDMGLFLGEYGRGICYGNAVKTMAKI